MEVASGNLLLLGALSIAAGVLVLVVPHILNYIVAGCLIVVGVLWVIAGL